MCSVPTAASTLPTKATARAVLWLESRARAKPEPSPLHIMRNADLLDMDLPEPDLDCYDQVWLRPSDTINTVSIAMAKGNFWQPLGDEGAADIYIAYPEYGPKLDNDIAERLNRTRFDYVLDEFPTPYVVELHATDEYEESNGTSIPFNIHLVENPVDLQRYSYIYSGNSYVLVYKNDVGLVLKKTNLGRQDSE